MSDQCSSIDQFVSYLRYERHFSPYTARCYGADLRQYAAYLATDSSESDGWRQIVEHHNESAETSSIRSINRSQAPIRS